MTSIERAEATDHARWLRALNGDPNGFSEIYDRYADRVLGYALRQTASWELAQDVVSITFLEVWRCRTNVRFDDDGSVAGWLFATARNVIRNQSRTLRRHHAAIERLHGEVASPDPADAVVERMAVEQRLKELLGVLDLLSRRDREVLSLVSAGLDSTAIATALDISEVAVRSRLSRSRQRLAKLVAAKRATRVPPPVKSVSSIPRQEGL